MLGQLLTVSQRGQQIETEFYCISHYYCMILLFNDIQYQSFVHREYIAIYSLDFYVFHISSQHKAGSVNNSLHCWGYVLGL